MVDMVDGDIHDHKLIKEHTLAYTTIAQYSHSRIVSKRQEETPLGLVIMQAALLQQIQREW
jgi:uncharacterized protein YueI